MGYSTSDKSSNADYKASDRDMQSVWHACLVAPSAFSCLRAAFALSVVCLLKVATLTYASLPETLAGPTALLTEVHICDVTGFSAMRCLVSLTVLSLSLLVTTRVTCMYQQQGCGYPISKAFVSHIRAMNAEPEIGVVVQNCEPCIHLHESCAQQNGK